LKGFPFSRRSFLLGAIAAHRSFGSSLPLPIYADATAHSGVRFKNDASLTSQKYLLESMCGGVAMLDYDGDGWLDLFFVNGAAIEDPMPAGKMPDKSDPRYWNRLYHNNRNGTFTDVTEKAGVPGHSFGMGVAVGDYDNDGHADIYVTNFGRNILYHNNCDGTFTDVTEKAGVGGGGWSTGACWVDYDRDGRLDLIVARYLEWDFATNMWCGAHQPGYRSYCHPDQFKPIAHLAFHNNGNGTFSDVSQSSRIGLSPGKGLGVAINDFDLDGWPDILIANDSFPQQLFRNDRDGTFTEIGLKAGLAYDEDGKAFAGMGLDFEDYDNDGLPDVFIDALGSQRYALFRNAKDGFEYVTSTTGVGGITLQHSGWGAKFFDYDNDGWKDLFVGQGHVMDNIELTQPNLKHLERCLLMRNVAGNFQDVTQQSGEALLAPRPARGVAFGDLDNDGFVDLAINCNNQPAVILRNQGGNGNHWLSINTVGASSNRDGIGARIRVVGESGLQQWAMVSTASSYLSANDKRAHFGLGKDKMARLVEVAWPSGAVQRMESVKADQILTIRETNERRDHAAR
jgi:enediyne biosynthesis protein E4